MVSTSFVGMGNQEFKARYNDDIKTDNYHTNNDIISPSRYFTENKGQFSKEVLFQTHVQEAIVYFCKNRIVTVFTSGVEDNNITKKDDLQVYQKNKQLTEPNKLEMISIVTEFIDANPETVVGQNQLSHKNNYFMGNNPEHWFTDVLNYRSVTYQDIYPGVDLTYYYSDGLLKYDFIVYPGGDPTQIAIQYKGADDIQMTLEGDIEISNRLGSICEERPLIYQEIDRNHQLISGGYILEKNDVYRFIIEDSYNQEYPLIIDPGLVYSTYFGGSEWEWGYHSTVDSNGCVYITGQTGSIDLPTKNPYDDTYNGNYDAFLTKFSSEGNNLEYSTFIGGSSYDSSKDVAVDNKGNAYVTGWTQSSDFPMVNSYDDIFAPVEDVYVAKISASGNELLYSTYLGGEESDMEGLEDSMGIEVDINGCAYVVGTTTCYDFPVENAFDDTYNGIFDVFITKLSSKGDTLEYSTFLGGLFQEEGFCIAVDNDGCAYVSGYTWSVDFPMQNPFDGHMELNDSEEIFVTKLSPQGNSLIYSTYFGGSGLDESHDITVDDNGCVYLTGQTQSKDLPTKNAFDDTFNGFTTDAFLTKFSPQGNTLKYSTFLGGKPKVAGDWEDDGFAIAVDKKGCAYIAGATGWTYDFPVVNAYDSTFNGGILDGFVAKFSRNGENLIYSTYLGGSEYDIATGIDVDDKGCAYVFGPTRSADFPTANAFDDSYNGNRDFYVTKLPEDGGGIVVKPTFLLGTIKSVEQDNNFINITAKLLFSFRFIPLGLRILSSGHQIIISNDYLGFVGERFIVGRFKADLD